MKKKRHDVAGEAGLCGDLKAIIHQHLEFFDKLIEFIPAKFYLPLDGRKVWFPGLSKEEKALAKKESKENIKKVRRERLDPEKSSTTTLHLLKQNLEKEKLKESDDEEVEINPMMTDFEADDHSVTYEELRQRLHRKIEELRAGRNSGGLEKVRKGGEKNDKKKVLQKKRKRESVPVLKHAAASASSENMGKVVAEAAKELKFSHVKIGNEEEHGKNKKRRKLSKLKELEKAKALAEAKKDLEKGEVISKKLSWNTATSRAAGIKVHDDLKLLEWSIKKEKKRHQKNAEKWKERVDNQQKVKAEKQQTRSQNIAEKIHQKKMRRIAKREKKLMRPGFEGRKKGYINEGSS